MSFERGLSLRTVLNGRVSNKRVLSTMEDLLTSSRKTVSSLVLVDSPTTFVAASRPIISLHATLSDIKPDSGVKASLTSLVTLQDRSDNWVTFVASKLANVFFETVPNLQYFPENSSDFSDVILAKLGPRGTSGRRRILRG